MDELFGADAAHSCGGGEDDAVGEYGDGEFFDVVGEDVVAAADEGEGAAGAEEAEGGAGGGAEGGVGVLSGGFGEGDEVFANQAVHIDFLGGFLQGEYLFRGGDGRQVKDGVGVFLLGDDADFLVEAGVAEADAHQEAIQLGFGEGEGAFVFDGVLGGDDEEGRGQGVGDAVDGDLAFFHGFQQGGLGFGGGAVDFVGEYQLGGDGAGAEAELAGGLVIDGDAGDVAGEQVGGELDAGEGAADGEGDGAGEHSFADAGDVFDQDVAFGDEGGQGLFDDGVFADDDGGDVVGDAAGDGGGVEDGGGDAGGGGSGGVQHGAAPDMRGMAGWPAGWAPV